MFSWETEIERNIPPQMHMYSLGMTLFWGADYEIPQSQVNKYHTYFLPSKQDKLYKELHLQLVMKVHVDD